MVKPVNKEPAFVQTTPLKLQDILKKIQNRQFVIPQFQRNFRWTESQVKLLIDSIARNYPLGSLLVLARNNDMPLKFRFIEAEIAAEDGVDDNTQAVEPTEMYYILDGQQRLTSIARVFLDANSRKNYYFDLKQMITSFDSEGSLEGTSYIKAQARSKKNPEIKRHGQLIRADLVLDQKKCDVLLPMYIEDSNDFNFEKQKAREVTASIKGIFETIRNYQIPVVTIGQETGLESICRVFETINSTGTRLTTFDLAVARFYGEVDLRHMLEQRSAGVSCTQTIRCRWRAATPNTCHCLSYAEREVP